MTAYSHILFDHDGVLVNTEPLYFKATQAKLADLGVHVSLDDYLRIQAVGGNAWSAALERGVTPRAVENKRNERNAFYQQLLSSEDIDIAGVSEALAALAERYTLAIVTTAKQEDFDLIHAGRDLVRHFDVVLTNKDYRNSKPHPEPYLTALHRFGIDPSHALVVEDSARGLAAAVAAQIDCAVVYHPFTAPQDFSAATYRLRDLSELTQLLMV